MAAGFAVAAMLAPFSAQAADWTDAFVGMRYGTTFREPSIPDNIAKTILQFQYVSGYKYGTNFFNTDVLLSNRKDPAAGGGGGATDIYVVYRHVLSMSAVTGLPLAIGPVRDFGLTAGIDLQSKNDAFGSGSRSSLPRKFVAGPTVKFDVPGYLDFSVLFRTENNNNSIVGKNVTFQNSYGLELLWGIPFHLGVPAKFKGFADLIGPKGKDGFGVQTKQEFMLETALMFDVGSLYGKKDSLYVGVGYQYWHNKFGVPPGVGTKASVVQLNLEYHL
ncbi:outer envelope protein [Pandoraea terrae]|uniref:outer envelope protein n=1 Tax=Pandoraea terrae TaxID=1537710 RepID=UPI00123FB726|nr:outer envelope protein [Pandoraea terrae]